MLKSITIAARHEGYRRCGIAHSVQPVTHPGDRFGARDLSRLRCDPHLVVSEEVAPPTKGKTGGSPSGEAGGSQTGDTPKGDAGGNPDGDAPKGDAGAGQASDAPKGKGKKAK